MSETTSIGFIGLGLLGLPIATNLVDAGYSLRLFNRTTSKAAPLVARGVPLEKRAVDTVTPGGVVVTVLWDDAALESVVTSDGFLERLGSGGVHVSMSTILPETGDRLAALHAEHGSTYVAAPVFGRPEAAAARKLTIPISGPQAAKERVRPLLEAMGAQGIFDFGEAARAATIVKIAGNFLIVSAGRSMVEALSMVEKSDVDVKAVAQMLTTTLFNTPLYQSYGKMIAEKSRPATESPIPRKDVGFFRQIAERGGSPAPIAERLLEMMESAKRGA